MDYIKEFNQAMDDCFDLENECQEEQVNHSCASAVLREITNDGISQSRVVELANYGYNLVSENTPINAFTKEPSTVGISNLVVNADDGGPKESLVKKIFLAPFKLIAKVIAAIASFVVKIIKWCVSKITGKPVSNEVLVATESLPAIPPSDLLRHLPEADQGKLVVAVASLNKALVKKGEGDIEVNKAVGLCTRSAANTKEVLKYSKDAVSDVSGDKAISLTTDIVKSTEELVKGVNVSDKKIISWEEEKHNDWVNSVKEWMEDAKVKLKPSEEEPKAISVTELKSIFAELDVTAKSFRTIESSVKAMEGLITAQEWVSKENTATVKVIEGQLAKTKTGAFNLVGKKTSARLATLRSTLNANLGVSNLICANIARSVSGTIAVLSSPNYALLAESIKVYHVNKKANKTFTVIDIAEHLKKG